MSMPYTCDICEKSFKCGFKCKICNTTFCTDCLKRDEKKQMIPCCPRCDNDFQDENSVDALNDNEPISCFEQAFNNAFSSEEKTIISDIDAFLKNIRKIDWNASLVREEEYQFWINEIREKILEEVREWFHGHWVYREIEMRNKIIDKASGILPQVVKPSAVIPTERRNNQEQEC